MRAVLDGLCRQADAVDRDRAPDRDPGRGRRSLDDERETVVLPPFEGGDPPDLSHDPREHAV